MSSDHSSQDSSLETTNSPSIDMDSSQVPPAFKPEAHHFGADPMGFPGAVPNSGGNLFNMHNYDDLLSGNVGLNGLPYNDNLLSSNQMDFLMRDFHNSLQGSSLMNPHTLQRGNAGTDFPLDAIPSPVLDAMNTTPQLNALTNGLLDMSHSNSHSHLPPLSIDANSHPSAPMSNGDLCSDAHAAFLAGTTAQTAYPASAPNMAMGNFEDRDFQRFMSLIQQNTAAPPKVAHGHDHGLTGACEVGGCDYLQIPGLPNHMPNHNVDPMQPQITPIPPSVSTALESASKHGRKRKNVSATPSSPPKKRKLNGPKQEKGEKRTIMRGRPFKAGECGAVAIKKERTAAKPQKGRGRKRKKGKQPRDDDYMGYLKTDYGRAVEDYVGIRTADGEVRIQIPPSSALKTEEAPDGNGITIKHEAKVKFEVFGNACSDRIEDILQPKKRTRYVRGLSEEEKKTRRREQNRNAAARSRARKNAMISKVIQLHQENMGLRAFVAENITQTKLLRDELNRLNHFIQTQQRQHSGESTASMVHPKKPPRPPTPCPPSASSSREEQSASIGTATTNTTSCSSPLF